MPLRDNQRMGLFIQKLNPIAFMFRHVHKAVNSSQILVDWKSTYFSNNQLVDEGKENLYVISRLTKSTTVH